MAIHWNESFSANDEKIDAQHKELFRLANLVDELDISSMTTRIQEKKTILELQSRMKTISHSWCQYSSSTSHSS